MSIQKLSITFKEEIMKMASMELELVLSMVMKLKLLVKHLNLSSQMMKKFVQYAVKLSEGAAK
jgi:hypothetical protein